MSELSLNQILKEKRRAVTGKSFAACEEEFKDIESIKVRMRSEGIPVPSAVKMGDKSYRHGGNRSKNRAKKS